MKVSVLFIFIFFLITGCSEKPASPDPQQTRIKAALEDLFIVKTSEDNKFTGLWKVKAESLKQVMQNKFLKKYHAQPDEASKEIIEKRLENTEIFLKLDASKKALMVTFSSGGRFGGQTGIFNDKPDKTILTLRGQNGTLDIDIELKNNQLHYYEPDAHLVFEKETRAPEKLIETYTQKINEQMSVVEY